MTKRFDEVITTRERLREIMGEPNHRVASKVIDHIDAVCKRFIAASPFVVIATKGGDGLIDQSPKGDPAGFVHVIDEKTLAIPDRLGNKRIDTFENILVHPEVGLIFLIPGYGYTLRVSGVAEIVCDRTLQTRLTVKGRPLLAVYKTDDIPQTAATVELWREACRREGIGEIYLAAVQHRAHDDPTTLGFDAVIEFPPIGHSAENLAPRLALSNDKFQGHIFRYSSIVAHYLAQPQPAFRQFRGVTPMWDNTARRQNHGMVLSDPSPELFRVWIERALADTRQRHRGDERLLFVNAWNEWGEGNHLEPDARYGRRYLEAVRAARMREFAVSAASGPVPPLFAKA